MPALGANDATLLIKPGCSLRPPKTLTPAAGAAPRALPRSMRPGSRDRSEQAEAQRAGPGPGHRGAPPAAVLAHSRYSRAQPSARSDYVTDINDYGSFLARKRGYDEIEGREPPVAPVPAAPTPVPVRFLARGCLVQIERWPGSWFLAKIVGVYAGDGPGASMKRGALQHKN